MAHLRVVGQDWKNGPPGQGLAALHTHRSDASQRCSELDDDREHDENHQNGRHFVHQPELSAGQAI